jgi:hypothetical protein
MLLRSLYGEIFMDNQIDKSYFNLNTSGIGYVNRIRTVAPKRGESFLCCDITALMGPSNEVEYIRFDCRVTGAEAKKLITRCENAVKEKRKVLINFRLGDMYIDTFIYAKGSRKGETGVSLKARLLYIGFIKIEGIKVYKAEQKIVNEDTLPGPDRFSSKMISAPFT